MSSETDTVYNRPMGRRVPAFNGKGSKPEIWFDFIDHNAKLIRFALRDPEYHPEASTRHVLIRDRGTTIGCVRVSSHETLFTLHGDRAPLIVRLQAVAEFEKWYKKEREVH